MKIASATLCVFTAAVWAAEPPKPLPAQPPPRKDQPAQNPGAIKPRLSGKPAPQAVLPPGKLTQPAPTINVPGLQIAPLTGGEGGPPITLHEGGSSLAPGIYLASPFSGIVVVPEVMDPAMVKPAPATPGVMPAPAPELQLTPKAK